MNIQILTVFFLCDKLLEALTPTEADDFQEKNYFLTLMEVICSLLLDIWWISNSDCYHLN